jgi:hypothetical protein
MMDDLSTQESAEQPLFCGVLQYGGNPVLSHPNPPTWSAGEREDSHNLPSPSHRADHPNFIYRTLKGMCDECRRESNESNRCYHEYKCTEGMLLLGAAIVFRRITGR